MSAFQVKYIYCLQNRISIQKNIRNNSQIISLKNSLHIQNPFCLCALNKKKVV